MTNDTQPTQQLTILNGDCREVLKTLPDQSVQCCVTSPPYWGLRNYGHDAQIGLEPTPEAYVATMVKVFREVRRVLREDGTLWLNLGSSYYSDGPKGSGGKSPKQITNSGSFFDDKRPIRSRSGVRACGNDGKEPRDLTAYDCACSCLCDGCRDALGLSRNENICQLHGLSVSPALLIAHDNGHLDCALEPRAASPLGVPESTTQQFSPQSQGECCHCSNCGVCLSVLRSSMRDARLCARNSWLNNAIVQARFKPKDLVPIPWMVAMALQADGWYLRSDIIWSKPNPMPESVTDRPTKAHEYLFLMSKNERYYYDVEAIKEPASDAMLMEVDQGYAGLGLKDYAANGVQNPSDVKSRIIANARKRADRFGGNKHNGDSTKHSDGSVYTGKITVNKRSVWTVSTAPFRGAHFATFPPDLIKPCILAGTKPGDLVLDPFGGSGTTGMVALELGRKALLIELNPAYIKLCDDRCNTTPGLPLAV